MVEEESRRGLRAMAEEESKKEEEEEESEIEELIIPGDVCGQEILSRLSGKDLQSLKGVCKDWIKLFMRPYFIRLHLSTPNYQTRIRVLKPLFHLYDDLKQQQIPGGIDDYDNYYSNSKQMIVPYPPGISDLETMIIGSVDGLICLLDVRLETSLERDLQWERYKIAIHNPSTRRFFMVQLTSSIRILRCWFGSCSSAVGRLEHVLVMLQVTLGPRYEFRVYKLTRSFTNLKPIQSVDVHGLICGICFDDVNYRGVLVHGAVHWRIIRAHTDNNDDLYHACKIIAYHLKNNAYVEFLPPARDFSDFRLGVVDGCLCATLKKEIRDSVFELWIRKESCWTKYANIHGFNGSTNLFPLGFFPSTGDLLLDIGSKLFKYNINLNQPTLLKDYGPDAAHSRHTAIICADSLVSPSICLV